MEIAILVNSCKKFYEKTIPKLLESANSANIPNQNIYVVVGECEEESEKIEDGVTFFFTQYTCIDYNACVYFSQNANANICSKV